MKKILKYAFIKSLPVLFGYIFMGIAFGILFQKAGYNFIWAFFVSLTCYAGSMQFVLITLLTGGASAIKAMFMTLMINFRHIFYGLSLVERFKKAGKAKFYLIHALTDETYSLLCLVKPQNDMKDKTLMLCISVLNHIYWITGCVLGAMLGQIIPFDTTGIDFAMTALFVVIFVEQWRESKKHLPQAIGLICALLSLLIFGVNNFLPPALVMTVLLLLFYRANIEKQS